MTQINFRNFINKSTAWFVFAAVLFLVLWNVGVFNDLNKRPQSMHNWAQCDRASVAKNYFENGFNFFLPRVHNIANGTGITGMEFPAINYAVAVLYRLFGFNEMYYRLLMLLIFTASLFAAYDIALKFCNSNFLFAIISVLMYALSPVLMYYAANFIPDIAAAAFTVIAWRFFFATDLSQRKNIFLITLFLSLGCLIKITCIISAVAMLLIAALDFITNKKEAKQNRVVLIPVFVSIMLAACWYSYSSWLNTKYQSGIFLMHPQPLKSFSHLTEVLGKITTGSAKEYYAYGFQWILIAINIVIIIFNKHASRKLIMATCLLYAGNICFFMLMASQFIQHDYYIITLLTAVLFNFILFFSVLESILKNQYVKIITAVLFLGFANYLMVFCKKNHTNRYDRDNWRFDLTTDRYFEMEPYLNGIGVKNNNAVIFYADPSPNISLYLIGRKGITVEREAVNSLEWRSRDTVFKFLIIDNTVYLSHPVIKPLIADKRKVGEYKGITIFKLHD